MNIIVYTKTHCSCAIEALDFLTIHNIPFEERDIVMHPEFKIEVEHATGQNKSPTLKIGDAWLPDAGVEDIAKALKIQV